MHRFDQSELQIFVSEEVITSFYEIRIQKLKELTFNNVMKRKNPYLFKAKNIQTAEELIRYILDAFLSSQEETIFGDLMEGLAIFVCSKAFNGYKAEQVKFKSVDLIFQRDAKKYIVGIKSGTNWGNSDQIGRMKANFKAAKKILKSEGNRLKIVAVNGCIYGKDNKPHKVDKKDKEKSYYKLCGQEFWELITGDKDFYQKIVIPIDKEAKKRDENFRNMYNAKINELTKDFSATYLTENGYINWEKLIDFVSKKN
ncbi:MAG: PmeII family type II restriction endonuclease [Candidatus Levybacteria bacterium]|nr:PmeII family type II restriction endonuclease [Candidatus Levybacteria bacterium]